MAVAVAAMVSRKLNQAVMVVHRNELLNFTLSTRQSGLSEADWE